MIKLFLPHAALLQGDMPNYTDIERLIEFSEILVSAEGERRRCA